MGLAEACSGSAFFQVGDGIFGDNGWPWTRWEGDNRCGVGTFRRPEGQRGFAKSQWRTYITTSFESESLFDIGPDIAITGEVGPEMIEGLPGEHHGSILGTIEKGPVHGLSFAHDLLGGQEILDDGIGRHHMHKRVAMTGDQVHMGELRKTVRSV